MPKITEPTLVVGREQQAGTAFGRPGSAAVTLFQGFTGVSEAPQQLDAFSTTLGAIVLRSLFKRFVKKPRKRGFLPILEATFCRNAERAAKVARTFHIRHQEGTLPRELQDWLQTNFKTRTPRSTSLSTFRRLANLLRMAFEATSIRLNGQPLDRTAASLERLISQEDNGPGASAPLEESLQGADDAGTVVAAAVKVDAGEIVDDKWSFAPPGGLDVRHAGCSTVVASPGDIIDEKWSCRPPPGRLDARQAGYSTVVAYPDPAGRHVGISDFRGF